MADIMTAASGWDITITDVQAIGKKRLNLMRAYNAREGLRRDRDTLPKKLFDVPLTGGRSDGLVIKREELEAGLDMYYEQAGWDETTGIPTRATLEPLGLGWVADELSL
jgi:aldehyde:ferredoxin oxidoreductase